MRRYFVRSFLSRFILSGCILLAVACSGGSASHGRLTAHSPVAATPSGPSPHPTSTPAAVAVVTPTPAVSRPLPAAVPGRCHTGGLTVALAGDNGAAGSVYLTFVLANTGTSPCSLYGYVGMQMLDASGRALPTKVVRNGVGATTAGPSRFLLPPGTAANFRASYELATQGGLPSVCPMAARLEITPPDEFDHQTIPLDMDPCLGQINVTPVAPPGALGSAS
jgi:uncharacterized protein DUF4232